MGGRDQSQVKNKSLKSSKKVSPFQMTYQKVITMTRMVDDGVFHEGYVGILDGVVLSRLLVYCSCVLSNNFPSSVGSL